MSLTFVLVMLGSAGVGAGGRRLLAARSAEERVSLHEFNSVKHRLVGAQAVVATVSSVVVLPHLGGAETVTGRVAFVSCTTLTLGAFLSREGLFGVGAGRRAAVLMAVTSCGHLLSALLLAAAGSASVASYLWVFAGWALAEWVLAWFVARRTVSFERDSCASSGLRILRSGRPIVVLMAAQAITSRGDRLVIGAMSQSSDLGFYGVAVSIMELLTTGAVALGQTAFHGLASGAVSAIAMTRARLAAISATAGASLVVVALAPWAVRAVFGEDFVQASPVVRILALAAVPCASYLIDTQYLVARAEAGAAASISVAGAVAMVGGDVLVLSWWGLRAAATVSLVVYVMMALVARMAVQRRIATPA